MVFGTVVWSADDRRGVLFDSPITERDVTLLQQEASIARFTTSPDERLALQDWLVGVAR